MGEGGGRGYRNREIVKIKKRQGKKERDATRKRESQIRRQTDRQS